MEHLTGECGALSNSGTRCNADAGHEEPAHVDQSGHVWYNDETVGAFKVGTFAGGKNSVHVFHTESSREVYDATQYCDDIKDGDIVVCLADKVVGFLAGAWPIAVTAEHGELHSMKDGAAWGNVGTDMGHEYGYYLASAIEAEVIARDNRWPLRTGR